VEKIWVEPAHPKFFSPNRTPNATPDPTPNRAPNRTPKIGRLIWKKKDFSPQNSVLPDLRLNSKKYN